MNKLDKLKWDPHWVSHLGCIKGCLNYLNLPVTDAWLYGATGHASILNVTPDLCPSGPTDWNTEKITRLGENIGYQTETVSGWKGNENLDHLQERAWEHIKTAIDKELPCFGWELDIPEFYVIFGYDDRGYFISGRDVIRVKGRFNGKTLVLLKSGLSMRDEQTVSDSLSYALAYAYNPDPWTNQRNSGGIKAFDTWIESLEKGIAAEFGLAYNSIVWLECRKNVVDYLREAKDQLNRSDLDDLFEKAINDCGVVSKKLSIVNEVYPFSQELEMKSIRLDSRSRKAADALRSAKEFEIAGLEILAVLIERMDR